ncbi:MAG: DUF84 family protein [bacterium]
MKIVIGSLRQPKIAAVKHAFAKIQESFQLQNDPVEFLPRDCASNISAMPLSTTDLMTGAYNRVQNLKTDFLNSQWQPDFFVGLEGGFFSQSLSADESVYFLQGWVYVSNGERGYFGASGAVPVPAQIVREVVNNRKELGDVIDRFGAETNIRNKDGAFGVFTNGILTRRASFEVALVGAFAPFFNNGLYLA